uniref:Uncharacterized protein n=1 Tax=Steinernema glaseri TaxID=37863 RepID=A0A1I8ADS2_9BILA
METVKVGRSHPVSTQLLLPLLQVLRHPQQRLLLQPPSVGDRGARRHRRAHAGLLRARPPPVRLLPPLDSSPPAMTSPSSTVAAVRPAFVPRHLSCKYAVTRSVFLR